MKQTIAAHFDGKAIIPDEPLPIPVGQRLRVRVELEDADPPRFSGLLQFAADLDGAPSDLAAQHDHYLYGTLKRLA